MRELLWIASANRCWCLQSVRVASWALGRLWHRLPHRHAGLDALLSCFLLRVFSSFFSSKRPKLEVASARHRRGRLSDYLLDAQLENLRRLGYCRTVASTIVRDAQNQARPRSIWRSRLQRCFALCGRCARSVPSSRITVRRNNLQNAERCGVPSHNCSTWNNFVSARNSVTRSLVATFWPSEGIVWTSASLSRTGAPVPALRGAARGSTCAECARAPSPLRRSDAGAGRSGNP